MVTSFSTPRPEMISPHRMMPDTEMLSEELMSVYAFSSSTPTRWAASVAHAARQAVMDSPNSVPSSAVEVRAVKPWAKYRTPNMITLEPISPSSSGGLPSTSPGRMNPASTA